VLRLFTPVRLASAGVIVAAATAVAVWAIPTESYIFLPHEATAVAPLVEVEGGGDPEDGGGIFFVDVLVRKATLLERIWPGVREGATVVPSEDVRPPGVSERERRREELAEMQRSQRVAAAVALRALGYRIDARATGARVEFVDPKAPAAAELESGDVVVEAAGRRVTAPAELRRAVRDVGVGKPLQLTIRRDGERQSVEVRTIRSDEGVPIIGIIVSPDVEIAELPLDVEIDTGGVGGPSAGLAFALDLLEELGRDVDRGHKIAVTGSLELDGTVGDIGGVKQKTIGVRRADIDVFVVPAGDNAAEARRHADGVRIVAVKSFQQALQALATLPRTAED
jgi:Lon-like protease